MRSFLFLLKFSYRNLWRAPKRTMIMVLSLSLAAGFIIWDLNFANSGSKEVMKEFLSQYAGRYQLTHPDYYEVANSKLFDNYKVMTDEQVTDKSLFATSTRRVTAPVFLSGEKKTLGVLMTGIEVDSELRLARLKDTVTKGEFLSPAGNKEIILGKRLAERLDVKIGGEVAVIGQALDGSVANDLYQVRGFLDFGGGDLEDTLAFTQITSARELLVMGPGQYHQLVQFDMSHETLPKIEGLRAWSWKELIPEISVSIGFVDNFTWIVSVIIVLVISLGLANTLIITFFEREKEFDALNVLGAKASWVAWSLLLEVTMLGIVSMILGCLVGHAATTFCSYYPVNLELFTNGKAIIMGGMTIKPLVKFYPVAQYYWQVPLMMFFFLALSMIYPLIRVMKRRKNAV
ncbi:MAG: FtsX-like permease family protein [Bdellovibrionota bacterium]